MRVRVPIFMFHHVMGQGGSAPRSALVVRKSTLSEIAAWFLRRNYESMTVKTLAEFLRAGDTASLSRRFVFTFDDGARDNFEHAYPVLKESGCVGTFYVPADYIGKTSEWRKRNRTFQMMSEGEILELSGEGFEIGSHGCQHLDLTALSDKELNAQMAESRAKLSSIIGSEVATLAYPYGLFDVRAVEYAGKAGYIAACSTIRGAVQDSMRPFALKRIMITEGTSSLRLRYFLSGLLDFEHRKEFNAANLKSDAKEPVRLMQVEVRC